MRPKLNEKKPKTSHVARKNNNNYAKFLMAESQQALQTLPKAGMLLTAQQAQVMN